MYIRFAKTHFSLYNIRKIFLITLQDLNLLAHHIKLTDLLFFNKLSESVHVCSIGFLNKIFQWGLSPGILSIYEFL